MLFLHCPKDELTKRLLERGKTSGRADDNIDSVLKRFDTFENESLPVVKQLEALGMVSMFEIQCFQDWKPGMCRDCLLYTSPSPRD